MKEEILQTALRQFLKYGIRKMSIQKLVAPLSISTKTVYKYFENKEELLKEALLLYYAQQYDIMEAALKNQNAVTLVFDIWYRGIEMECKVNNIFFRDLNYYYPDLEKKVEASVSKKIWKQIIEIIKKGIRQGFFREDIDAGIALEAISAVYVSISRTTNFKKFKDSILDIFLNSIAVFIRGFCTPKGIEELESHVALIRISGKFKVSALIDVGKN